MLDKILSQPIKITPELILDLISFIDLTTLNDTDHDEAVIALVEKANKGFKDTYPAAVCVFPNFGALAKSKINSGINVAVVGTCFPSGQTFLEAKLFEVDLINQTDIEEVDMVIHRGAFLSGDFESVKNEIVEVKKRILTKHLKVILETGQLTSEENIKIASKLAIDAGADFIKTSTGKASVGSTPEAVYYMCQEIKTFYLESGKKIGLKPAGGIRTLEDALVLYKIVKSVLGEEWLKPELFRIGASSLYDNLIQYYNEQF